MVGIVQTEARWETQVSAIGRWSPFVTVLLNGKTGNQRSVPGMLFAPDTAEMFCVDLGVGRQLLMDGLPKNDGLCMER
jgi:hypothetical protein